MAGWTAGWSDDWLTCQCLFLFPVPCHECCHQHGPNWINPLILLVHNINVSLIKLHAPASFFCFCVPSPFPIQFTALSQRPFEFPTRREWVRIERRSWCPTCVRTCADTCTPMCLVTLFHQLAMTTLLARALRPTDRPPARPPDCNSERLWTGLARPCRFSFFILFFPCFCLFLIPQKPIMCWYTYRGQAQNELREKYSGQ